jgi:hypothetical protein
MDGEELDEDCHVQLQLKEEHDRGLLLAEEKERRVHLRHLYEEERRIQAPSLKLDQLRQNSRGKKR